MNARKTYDARYCSPLKRVGKPLETMLRSVTVPTRDFLHNRRHVRADRKIAVVRHLRGLPSYYRSFLSWTAENLPDVHSRIEQRLLPCDIRDWSRYALIVSWIPETLLCPCARIRRQALALTTTADAHGVPVINRPERLLSLSKHDCARQIASSGVRTPRMDRIVDMEGFKKDLNGLTPPLLVREDLGHGGWNPVFLVRRPDDARNMPLEMFANPIAAEFIDVRDPRDGLVRKYRYMAIGETGIAHTLQISPSWEVRSGVRLLNEQTKREEIQYADAPDPHHEVLQRVRCGLGLDSLAFDYSYDQEGQLVVWEINVLPGLGIPSEPDREHLTPPIERAMAATLKLYLDRAGLDVPKRVEELLTVKPRGLRIAPGTRDVQRTIVRDEVFGRREAA